MKVKRDTIIKIILIKKDLLRVIMNNEYHFIINPNNGGSLLKEKKFNKRIKFKNLWNWKKKISLIKNILNLLKIIIIEKLINI